MTPKQPKKKHRQLKLTKKALLEFPEYRGAKLTFIKYLKLTGISYLGYRVKVSHQKPFTEDWDSMWFEKANHEKPTA